MGPPEDLYLAKVLSGTASLSAATGPGPGCTPSRSENAGPPPAACSDANSPDHPWIFPTLSSHFRIVSTRGSVVFFRAGSAIAALRLRRSDSLRPSAGTAVAVKTPVGNRCSDIPDIPDCPIACRARTNWTNGKTSCPICPNWTSWTCPKCPDVHSSTVTATWQLKPTCHFRDGQTREEQGSAA